MELWVFGVTGPGLRSVELLVMVVWKVILRPKAIFWAERSPRLPATWLLLGFMADPHWTARPRQAANFHGTLHVGCGKDQL